jgi:hypothetical protein
MRGTNNELILGTLLVALGGCFGGSDGDGTPGGGTAGGGAGDGAAGTGAAGSGAAGDQAVIVGEGGRGGTGAAGTGAGGGEHAASCASVDADGRWVTISDAGAPPDLSESSWLDAVAWWTGTRATFLYKGYEGDLVTFDGAAFDPANNVWSAVNMADAPNAPQRMRWTGDEVIAWSPASGTGAFYDPTANAWNGAMLADAPDLGGTWNGARMLVTENGSVSSADDFRMAKIYDFHAGTWARVAGDGALPRSSHGTAIVGDQLVVWGGWANGLGESLGDGAVFDFVTAQSTPTSAEGAPSPRYEPVVVAAGDRVIVWGGATIPAGGKPEMLSDGAIYDPAKDSWQAMSETDAPAGRAKAVAVWTGTRLIVTGGHVLDPMMPGGYGPDMAEGGIFDPDANAWIPLAKSPSALPGQPPAGPHSRILITENHEVVFLDEPLTAIQILDADENAWRTVPLDDTLKDRLSYWAFWSGCELVVWGGKRVTDSYDCADAPPDQPVCDPWVEYESLPDGKMFVP